LYSKIIYSGQAQYSKTAAEEEEAKKKKKTEEDSINNASYGRVY
jgi:hypothetical protein